MERGVGEHITRRDATNIKDLMEQFPCHFSKDSKRQGAENLTGDYKDKCVGCQGDLACETYRDDMMFMLYRNQN